MSVTVLGRCRTGIVATSDECSFSYFLTDCCGASATGTEYGAACRSCYHPVDDSLGGVYDARFDGPIGPLTDDDVALLAAFSNVTLPAEV